MQSSQGTALQCAVLGDQSTCDNRRQCMFLHSKTFFAARSREGTALLYFFFFLILCRLISLSEQSRYAEQTSSLVYK